MFKYEADKIYTNSKNERIKIESYEVEQAYEGYNVTGG